MSQGAAEQDVEQFNEQDPVCPGCGKRQDSIWGCWCDGFFYLDEE
jgi:hypothetical protein